MRSKIRGVAKTRRLLKRMPDGAKAEVLQSMEATGKQLRDIMRGRAPVLSHPVTGRVQGALRAAIDYKMYPTTLRMTVGVQGSKKARNKLFYGWILERGRRAQDVAIRHGPRAGATMHVSSIAAMHFVFASDAEPKNALTRNLQNFWPKALARVAEGGDYGD